MKEVERLIQRRAQVEMNKRARDKCGGQIADFAACMKIEAFLGPYKCRAKLDMADDCIRAHMDNETLQSIISELRDRNSHKYSQENKNL